MDNKQISEYNSLLISAGISPLSSRRLDASVRAPASRKINHSHSSSFQSSTSPNLNLQAKSIKPESMALIEHKYELPEATLAPETLLNPRKAWPSKPLSTRPDEEIVIVEERSQVHRPSRPPKQHTTKSYQQRLPTDPELRDLALQVG